MNKIQTYLDFLIPKKLKGNPFVYRKAKVLTYVIVFAICTGIVLQICTMVINPQNPIDIYSGILGAVFALYIFKETGNFVIVSNLLACLWVYPLFTIVPDTGGLYSDNLLWMFFAPLSTLLFANRRSSFTWLAILLGYTYYMYLYYSDKALMFHLSKEGPEYFLISYTCLFIVLFIVVLIFETGQLLIIKMLTEQKATLEYQTQEIIRKNAELEAIEERLRDINQELENFAFAASHDLKEPLRMIGMYTQLTQRRLNGKLDSSTTEFMGYVTEGVGRMQNLLDSLLDYSRLGKNKEDVRNINLNDTLFMVIHNLAARIKETEAAIVGNELPIVEASSFEMIQLFQNLISNAIKFRRPHINPVIEIKVGETAAGEFLFTVADNGIGIAEEHKDKVFKIFERLHTRTDYEGSGIGLATCKKIVQSAGGKIWLDSKEGMGTTFFFTLPKEFVNSN